MLAAMTSSFPSIQQIPQKNIGQCTVGSFEYDMLGQPLAMTPVEHRGSAPMVTAASARGAQIGKHGQNNGSTCPRETVSTLEFP